MRFKPFSHAIFLTLKWLQAVLYAPWGKCVLIYFMYVSPVKQIVPFQKWHGGNIKPLWAWELSSKHGTCGNFLISSTHVIVQWEALPYIIADAAEIILLFSPFLLWNKSKPGKLDGFLRNAFNFQEYQVVCIKVMSNAGCLLVDEWYTDSVWWRNNDFFRWLPIFGNFACLVCIWEVEITYCKVSVFLFLDQ